LQDPDVVHIYMTITVYWRSTNFYIFIDSNDAFKWIIWHITKD